MSSNGANRNIIWAESAKVKGLVDTTDGIKFIPSSADNEDETELALINNNVTTESFAAPLIKPKAVRPCVVTPDDLVSIPRANIKYEQLVLHHADKPKDQGKTLFRPIRSSRQPVMVYETLYEKKHLCGSKSRRESTRFQGVGCDSAFAMPSNKKTKMMHDL